MMRGVIFDCFGVLYGGCIDILAAMAPEGRAQEVRDISLAKDYGYISYKDHINQIASILGKTTDEVDSLIQNYQVPNTDLIAYARQLKDKYKVGLLSNTGDRVVEALFGDEVTKLFDAVILSCNEGMTKPDPKIFALAAMRLGLTPEECIMVDDIKTNCDGARLAGMRAVVHTSNKVTRREVNKLIGKS